MIEAFESVLAAAPPEYRELLQPHRRALLKLQMDLQFYIEEVGPIIYMTTEARLKDYQGAADKAKEKNINIEDLDDLAGLRVIVGTASDTQLIRHFVENGLRGVNFKVLEDGRRDNEGYRAHHVIIEIPENYTGTWMRCRVEVQIHTLIEHAFNRLSRQWKYRKQIEFPEGWEQQFAQLADDLAELDVRADALAVQLLTSESGVDDEAELNPIAYKVILHEILGEVADDEDAVWHCLFYRRHGLMTCGDLRAFFGRNDVAELYVNWLQLPEGSTLRTVFASSKQTFWQTLGGKVDRGSALLKEELAKAGR